MKKLETETVGHTVKFGETGQKEEDFKLTNEVIKEKLLDAETPGFQAEFDPLEALMLGAFEEDALSEADALNSCTAWHPDEDLS